MDAEKVENLLHVNLLKENGKIFYKIYQCNTICISHHWLEYFQKGTNMSPYNSLVWTFSKLKNNEQTEISRY